MQMNDTQEDEGKENKNHWQWWMCQFPNQKTQRFFSIMMYKWYNNNEDDGSL